MGRANVIKKCNQRLYALRIIKPICDDHQLRAAYFSLIHGILCYAAPLFMNLPAKIFIRIQIFVRRCHKVIHATDCQCHVSRPYESVFTNMAFKLFEAAQSSDHPLHYLIPRRLPRSNRWEVVFSRTLRRQRTFPCNVVLAMNSFT